MWSPRQAIELVESLQELGFPDHLFKAVHPMGHGMLKYRTYCERKERFTSASSSNVLCARLQLILEGARRLAPLRPAQAQWRTLVDVAVQTAPDATPKVPSDCQPVSAAKRTHRRLEAEHEEFIAMQIAALIPIAANRAHSMNLVARWQIKNTLWRWTVDGVDSTGFVRIDAAKRVHGLLPMTRKASSTSHSAQRVHEHIVPRELITTYLINRQETGRGSIVNFLRRYCLAAIVTKDEDKLLNTLGLQQRMPDGWSWGDDPWARYRKAGLFEQLIWPDDWPKY